jgi:hypothetical protein
VEERSLFGTARALCLALGLSIIASSSATTVVAPRFEALVDHSDLIFTGQMLSQRSEWQELDGQRSIVTLVTFGVQRIHKGRAASTVTLQFLGGKVGDVSLEVAEMPTFKPGERVLLFVAENGVSACPVVAFFHGKFTVHADGKGGDEVRRHNGEPLVEVGEIGPTKTKGQPRARRALSHDEFSTKIRERAVRGAKQ